jgi:UDP-N-acetylmuramate dehydrogenase
MSRKVLKEKIPLAKYTTLGIGGPADYVFLPKNIEELKEALDFAEGEGLPVFILGGGSNVLFPDSGYRGVVIRMAAFNSINFKNDQVEVEAGVSLGRLINLSQREGLSGFEPLFGIPGDVGGAIVMNAGSFGREIKDLLLTATILTWESELIELPLEELGLQYRRSKIHEMGIITKAKFQLVSGDSEKIAMLMEETLEKRRKTQPFNERTAGCVFKNPPGHPPAGELLDRAGLKGVQIGGAKYSEVHANFILNLGDASSKDVIELINLGQKRVFDMFGVKLEPEIVIVEDTE